MQRSPYAPALSEDEQADLAVRRGRNVGALWVFGAAGSFGMSLMARSATRMLVALCVSSVLLTVALFVRARYWDIARRRLGDATIQRARWRSVDVDRYSPAHTIAAVALVALLLGYELWRS